MKTLVVLIFVLFATSSFANISRPSTESEVRRFCQAIEKALVDTQADMAIDMNACLVSKMRTVGHYVHGTVIRGTVPFRSPGRSLFKMTCEAPLKSGRVLSESVNCQ
ncbi:hypothetical protein [Peredibacter starrii]|uniref:Uncharacterized protein n=1 Tax=Peredibacter starrii TaxID=28202 RepID=A0AAX4HM79_9BACT|nr:hypothetical protein [Peredibacter starrii]WPU64326.1 hypothetical protein SOO65_16650 [Peredibacter starrii]